MNENDNKAYQYLRDAGKAVLKRKFVAVNTYIKKQNKTQTDNVTFHFKALEKENYTQSKQKEKK